MVHLSQISSLRDVMLVALCFYVAQGFRSHLQCLILLS